MAIVTPFIIRSVQAPSLQFLLSKPIVTLGRSSSCDFVVADASVSRCHAKMFTGESGLQVTDLDSRNGTFVANVRLQGAEVRPGQVVRFGNVAFAVGVLDPSSEAETDAPTPGNDGVGGPGLASLKILSPAQRRVFKQILSGLPEKAIAKQLHLSPHTVHKHTQAVFQAFGVHSRAHLIAMVAAANVNLLPEEP